MSIAVTFLEQGKQSAADIGALLAEFLAGARSSLHVAIYDCRLSDEVSAPILKVLGERAAAGVDVRIVYDSGKPANPMAAGADPAPPGTAAFMKRIVGKIGTKAITGGHARNPRLMHHKYVIRDGKSAAGAVWTGSANFTDDSWTLQENNIVRIDSPELCGFYETDFEELWARGDIDTTGAQDHGSLRAGDSVIGVMFAPGDGRIIDHDVAERIGTARRRLKICSMLITSGSILGALGDTLHRGRIAQYGGLYDRTQMESVFDQWRGTPVEWKIAAFQQIAEGLAGKRSTPYSPSSTHDFMHNKVMIVDDTVITGSYNLSHSATENAENVVMIQDRQLADRYDAYIDGLVGRYRGTNHG
jgi:phosphatidylserine/phosphatidylglycerophosphate/cardiolipin synthase-like enzyme